MRYSKWLPDRGGYAYYETPERRGLGDDLPVPQLTATSEIGVASTEIGRAMPLGAKFVGYGQLAQGCVAPLDRSGLTLSGISTATPNQLLMFAAIGAVAVMAGVVAVRRLK